MSADTFAIMLSTATFVLGVAVGLFIGDTRAKAQQRGRPVSSQRLARLWVIDPREIERERQHPTIGPIERER